MKRIIAITLILFALVIPAKAATSISFMGISMDYKIDAFCQKLVSSYGFSIIKQEPDLYQLQGTYMGIPKCTVNVASHSNGGKVAAVIVTFPEQKSWAKLKQQYEDVYRRFRINPQYQFMESSTTFESPYYEGCSNELDAVREGKCKYYTILSKGDNVLLLAIDTNQTVNVFYVDSNTVADLFSAMNGSSSSSSSSSAASSSSDTLSFLGLPMQGTYKEFGQRLINERDFTFYDETPSVPSISLRGTIDGKSGSEVYIFGDSDTKIINRLNVYLPEQSSWNGILQEYTSYIHDFSQRYEVLEQFAEFEIECTGNEVEAVKDGKCNYATYFNVPGGVILVQISFYMQVEISYICNNYF
ncbi:MAG: hypothetical protein ACI4AM_01395 [Muribaculaceae bacterium]